VENVTALYFPIYCMKLYNAMGEALGFTDDSATESDTQAISRRFEGRVLVAEDNVANRELIRIILEKYGIEATIVENGEEAVERFDPGAFDLILMDEQMPRMNGKEAMHRIRKETGSSVPIVAVTANVVNEARERGIRSGYDAFVGKPINVAELEEVLERYLDEKTPYEMLPAVPDEAGRRVRGLDMEKLRKELMLDDAEILLLLEVFLGKVRRLMLEMGEAVDRSDYERIASTAHSVKGSSANFRLKRVQDLAKEMEDAASKKEKGFDYEAYSRAIGDELATIGIES
jgi:CheY-like chemotaxis protein/HPt (histidine-containing phosphotransfer) domain-containing protein